MIEYRKGSVTNALQGLMESGWGVLGGVSKAARPTPRRQGED